MNKPITLQMLKDSEACREQVVLFEAAFGQQVLLTPEIVEKYHNKFNIDWIAKHVLKGSARKDYEAVQGLARRTYEASKPGFTVFKRIHVDVADQQAWKEYTRTIALAFMRIWNNE